jgi:hypothetical protein
VNFVTGNTPYGVVLADIDGDGKLDIVTANNGGLGSDRSVSVLRNTSTNGSITSNSFAAHVDFEVAQGPTRVVVADLDGDGRMDIVAITAEGGGISVLRNTGSVGVMDASSFAPFIHFLTGPNNWDVRIADLDGDGKPDLLGSSFSDGIISILKNVSSPGGLTVGSFVSALTLNPGTLFDVGIGDLNGDGKLDLAVGKYSAGGVAVFQNNSTNGVLDGSSFAAPVSFATPNGPSRMAIGDLNGDGKPDIAITTDATSVISVLRNTGTNGPIASDSFAAAVSFASGGSSSMAIEDLDGDGRPELVASSWGSSVVSILRNLVYPTPPIFIIQPSNTVAVAGTNVSLVSLATGSPLFYQWFKNDVLVPGATNATLTFTNVSWSDAGTYKVTVTNSFDSATSSNAVLTIYAHHFDLTAVPSPQAPQVPFAVSATAKDARNLAITNFSGPVALYAVATNFAGTNLGFEGGSLQPWTPLNLGDQPGPYDLITYDVNGDTNSSTAFRIAANSGAPDGITQDVPLLGGLAYTTRVDIATENLIGGNNLDGGTTALSIGGTKVKQFSWGPVSVGKIYRTNLAGTFTPPTNGYYPVTLTFQRAYLEAGNLWCFADDLVIRNFGGVLNVSPTSIADFTNGIWSGLVTVMDPSPNVTLRVDDGHGHFGNSNPFSVTNPLAPLIVVQPASQNAIGGNTVFFSVDAAGAPVLQYRWRKNGTNIAGATGALLTLSNVTRFSSAAYSVVVSNVYGSVTSSNASLMVRVPQRLGYPALTNNSVNVTSSDFDGGALTAGDLARFSVLISTNLMDWTNLPVPLIFNNGSFRFTAPFITNQPIRFYRIIEN